MLYKHKKDKNSEIQELRNSISSLSERLNQVQVQQGRNLLPFVFPPQQGGGMVERGSNNTAIFYYPIAAPKKKKKKKNTTPILSPFFSSGIMKQNKTSEKTMKELHAKIKVLKDQNVRHLETISHLKLANEIGAKEIRTCKKIMGGVKMVLVKNDFPNFIKLVGSLEVSFNVRQVLQKNKEGVEYFITKLTPKKHPFGLPQPPVQQVRRNFVPPIRTIFINPPKQDPVVKRGRGRPRKLIITKKEENVIEIE